MSSLNRLHLSSHSPLVLLFFSSMKSHSDLHSSRCSAPLGAAGISASCSAREREKKGERRKEKKRTNKPEAAPVLFLRCPNRRAGPRRSACGRQIMIIVCECVLCTPPPPHPLPFDWLPLSAPQPPPLVFSFLAAAEVGWK